MQRTGYIVDLNPDDQDAEVTRLEGLGATRVDIGQGEQPWVVMADPEGNEFCVLHTVEPSTARCRAAGDQLDIRLSRLN